MSANEHGTANECARALASSCVCLPQQPFSVRSSHRRFTESIVCNRLMARSPSILRPIPVVLVAFSQHTTHFANPTKSERVCSADEFGVCVCVFFRSFGRLLLYFKQINCLILAVVPLFRQGIFTSFQLFLMFRRNHRIVSIKWADPQWIPSIFYWLFFSHTTIHSIKIPWRWSQSGKILIDYGQFLCYHWAFRGTGKETRKKKFFSFQLAFSHATFLHISRLIFAQSIEILHIFAVASTRIIDANVAKI